MAETAKALKQSIGKTGLFYESHLQALAQGEQNLDSLKQEPQNAQRQLLPTVVSQQLSLLETQKLAWSGEVWPGQVMQMDIAPVTRDEHGQEEDKPEQQDNAADAIESVLSLDLPKLGKVKIKLNLQSERLNVQMQAQQDNTRSAMRDRQTDLRDALKQYVDTVDAMSIQPFEAPSAPEAYRPVKKVEDD